MNSPHKLETEKVNTHQDEVSNNSPDPYYGGEPFKNLSDEEKSDPLFIIAFFVLPVGIFLFFKYKKKNKHLAGKFILASIFGLIMLLFIMFLIYFLSI